MGAWIEILAKLSKQVPLALSRPSWARGLKSLRFENQFNYDIVAPLMGAWIEILFESFMARSNLVGRAPHGRVD